MSKNIDITKDFIRSGGKDVPEIASKHNVSRQAVYQAVGRVRQGNKAKQTICEMNVKFECLWQNKYKAWFECIPLSELRTNEFVKEEFQRLIKAMKKDKFPTAEIARRVGKDHATIRHHLKTKKQ